MNTLNNKIKFVLDNNIVELDFEKENLSPTTTVLNYLRKSPSHKGVKEGCAEGDCGACTIVIAGLDENDKLKYRAYDSCLIFLPFLHGKQLITVENVGTSENLHPVQKAVVDLHGSQCGFCTPGIVMSIFALYKSPQQQTKEDIEDALTGNLCRCTGYRPIVDAAIKACSDVKNDSFSANESHIVSLLKSINESNQTVQLIDNNQKYFVPTTLKAALELKSKYPNATVINGSTDIALRVTKKRELISEIIDLSHICELKKIENNSNEMLVGAGVNLESVRHAIKDDFKELYAILSRFGSRQIRNRATFGGNIGSASPIGDTIPFLMMLDAVVVLQNQQVKREINISKFIVAYRKTVINPDELIIAVKIPKQKQNSIIKTYKVSKRKDLDISTVSAAFRLEKDENNKVNLIKLYFGGMSAFTKNAEHAETALIGREWNRQNVEKAMLELEKDFTPLSDARSTAQGRKIMAKNLLMKFYNDSFNNG